MAAIEVSKLFTERGAKDDLENHRTYTRMYEVITNSAADDERVVSNASVGGVSVPIPGEVLDADPRAYCVSVEFRQSDDAPTIWYVTAQYDSDPSTALGGGSGGGNGPDRPDNKVDADGNSIEKGERKANPYDEPPQWTLSFEDSEEPAIEGVEVDGAGNLVIPVPPDWGTNTDYTLNAYAKAGNNVYVCTLAGTSAAAGSGPAGTGTGIADNTAVWAFYATFKKTQTDPNNACRVAIRTSGKLPFDPPAMTPVSRLVYSVTKNMPPLSVAGMIALKNAVNLYTWRGIPPRCARVRSVTDDGGKELNGIPYTTAKWEIVFDVDTHDLRILDCGYGYLATRTDPATGLPVTKYMRFVDVSGQPLDHPIPLNGAGQPLNPDDPPVFRRYVPRQTRLIDFNLALPF